MHPALILFNFVFAVICALIANSKGRSVVGWFFIGLVITWIGLILVLVLANLKERDRVESASKAERRRLREQLRQERMKNEAYRRHAASRLDMHDRALGMDTRKSEALPAGHGLQQPLLDGHAAEGQVARGVLDEGAAGFSAPRSTPSPGRTPPVVNAPAEWHYERRGESKGPVAAGAIRQLVSQGRLDGTALVWREGMADWRPVSQVPQFRSSFQG